MQEPWDEPLALVQPLHSPRGWAAVTPQHFSMGIWTEALQTHFLSRSRPLMGTGLALGHPAELPNVRGSVDPVCSRGPSRPPRSCPVCSFLMSSKSGMEPGPFSSLGHLGGSRWIWVRLRWWATEIPLQREHSSRLPPRCCHPWDTDPPFGALLELSAPCPFALRLQGKMELMEKREPHASNMETSRKRPWESGGSSPSCCSPCGFPVAGGRGGGGGLASRDPRSRGGGGSTCCSLAERNP